MDLMGLGSEKKWDHELSFGVILLNPCPGRNSSWLIGWLICSFLLSVVLMGSLESERCCSARRNAGM